MCVVLLAKMTLTVNNPVQVRLHELRDDVDVGEVLNDIDVVPLDHVKDGNNIVVLEGLEELYLAQNPLRVYGILKGVADLLDGDVPLALPRVLGAYHNAVRSAPDAPDELIMLVNRKVPRPRDLERDHSGHGEQGNPTAD